MPEYRQAGSIFDDGNGDDDDDVNNAMKAACDTKQKHQLQSVQ